MNHPVFGILLLLASFNIAASLTNTSSKETIKAVDTPIEPIVETTTTITNSPVHSTTSSSAVTTTAQPTTNATSTSISTPTTNKTTVSTEKPVSNSPVTTVTFPVPNTSSSPVEPIISVKGRHFDGLSFMGGIILTTCLVGLSVGSYKFYKIKTEQSYLTL